jgi:hypothetical protein
VTRRDAILAVLNRESVEKSPVSVRIELWYADAVLKNSLVQEIRGFNREEVEDYLGFCRAVRYRTHPQLRFKNVEIRKRREKEEVIEEYLFRGKTLIRRTHQPGGIMAPYIVKYPLEAEEDYELLLSEMEEAYLDFDTAGFDELDGRTGDAGLPVLILHSCPAHLVMLQWSGYEHFFLHLSDFPDKVETLIHRIEEVYRRDLWPAACSSQAKLVFHGNHFNTQMTPPPIFEKYFLPYFEEFNKLMHGHRKKVMWHADAEMGGLMGQVLEAGFDVADCLATTPLVSQRIEDYFNAWKGRIVCWGGLPSIVFDPTFPIEKYKRYVDHLVEVTRSRNDFIFGASDQVMPGARWERLLYLAEATGTLK